MNTYDHDVSACLLRDGEIAFAIAKERITREKHASGFYQEVVDYCLEAEGISMDDIDLVVRNCYILPVEEMETTSRSIRSCRFFWPRRSGEQAAKNPLFPRPLEQSGDGIASPRARLQRLCRLSVRSGRRHGGGRRGQLQL